MKILRTVFILLFLTASMASCTWTQKKRDDFAMKCSQTDTIDGITVLFRGFDNNEFDSILIKEYKDTIFLDSFMVFVMPAQSPFDIERKERSSSIDRIMNTKHSYQFFIPGQEPYELANMKMVMWAQYSMCSEGWGCVMGDYTIDGVRFENDANPIIIKRDISETK